METAVEEKPAGIREVERTDLKIRLSKHDLPWLSEGIFEPHLVKIKIGSSQLLFGSAIKSPLLVEAAKSLDAHRSQICNNLLYTHLAQYAEGYNPHVKVVEDTRTRQPIFYVSNKGGQRVYFMRFGNIDNMPVIIKIAVCDKSRQTDVLSVITTNSRRQIKSRIE